MANCISNIRFFAEKGPDVLLECCKHLKVLTFEPNETIFKEGSYGSMFYIILRGSVLIYKHTHNAENQIHSTEMIKTLNEGSSFGELALIEKRPRAATIVSRDFGVFAVMEKKDFRNILSIIFFFAFCRKLNFLKNFIFCHFNLHFVIKKFKIENLMIFVDYFTFFFSPLILFLINKF